MPKKFSGRSRTIGKRGSFEGKSDGGGRHIRLSIIKRKFSPRKHGLFTKRCCSEQIQHQLTGNDKKCSGKGSQPVAPLPPFEKNLCKSVCYCLCLPGCLPAHLPDCSPTCLSTGPRYAASTCNRDPTGQSGSYSSRRKPRFWGCPGGHLGLFLAS